jgi:hypothetical protein
MCSQGGLPETGLRTHRAVLTLHIPVTNTHTNEKEIEP